MPLKDDKEAETTVVKNEDIHEHDVLMGRGGKNNRHVGNEKLRDMARGEVEKYKMSTKKIKSAISRDIVKKVRNLDPPGRFLKRVPETGEWEDVGDYLAREKVAQVLRDAVCEAAEAMRPNVPAHIIASASPYASYPDGGAAAGVFRHSPAAGAIPFGRVDSGMGSGFPVVTASGSSSFGHPPGYHMPPPPPWFPYGPPVRFPGMPPFPPGYQQSFPQSFSSSAAAHAAYISGTPGAASAASVAASSTTSGATASSAAAAVPKPATPAASSQSTPADSSAQTQPTSSQTDAGTGFQPSYSISLSVAAAPGGAPITTRTEAYMSWNPPEYEGRGGRRKRSRSLPGETQERSSPPSETSSPPSAEKSPAKISSATQTPPYNEETDAAARGHVRSVTIPTRSAPLPIWGQQPHSAMLYGAGQQTPQAGHVYYEQRSQHYFDQSAFQLQSQPTLPPPHPPGRSFSAPPPAHAVLATAADSLGESNDGAPPGHSLVQRSSFPTLSSRKVRRVARPGSGRGEEGGGADMQEEQGDGMAPMAAAELHREATIEPIPALPGAASRQTARRSSRSNLHGSHSTSDEGMDWFPGQLLLESDEEESEHGDNNDDKDNNQNGFAV